MATVWSVRWRGLACASLLFGAALASAVSWGGGAAAEDVRFFRIGASATAGSFFELGGAIASVISNPPGAPICREGGTCGVPGLVAVAQGTQGSLDNLRMINAGQIETGFAQGDLAAWAHDGSGPFAFAGAMPKLRTIAGLFPESLHLVVRAESAIRTVADLKGKRLALGESGSGTVVNARVVLKASGLGDNDVEAQYLKPGEAADELKDGKLDAFFMVGAPPIPAIHDLAAAIPIRLVPIDGAVAAALKKEYPLYVPATIAAVSYPQTEIDTATLGFAALWLAGADIDADLVYAITKALWAPPAQKLLSGIGSGGRQIQLGHALDGVGVPLHPGAERFYREAGLAVDKVPPRAPLDGTSEKAENK